MRCWGENYDGQLGDGTTTARPSPTAVPGLSGVTAIAAGFTHTCALLGDGTMRCWGDNIYGALGDGTTTQRLSPVTVLIGNVTQITTGGLFTCALLTTGTVECWGTNNNAQVGDGTMINRSTPASVTGLSGVVEIATGAGADHTCARLSSGAVDCWGWNVYGQIGDGTTTTRSSPTPVSGLAGVTHLGLGGFHNCAVDLGHHPSLLGCEPVRSGR